MFLDVSLSAVNVLVFLEVLLSAVNVIVFFGDSVISYKFLSVFGGFVIRCNCVSVFGGFVISCKCVSVFGGVRLKAPGATGVPSQESQEAPTNLPLFNINQRKKSRGPRLLVHCIFQNQPTSHSSITIKTNIAWQMIRNSFI